MLSSLRTLAALLGVVIAVPLTVQASTLTPPPTDTTTATTSPAIADTAVTWINLSSKNGTLKGHLPTLLNEEITKARASGRTPFLAVGATWCGPCLELEASLHSKEMIDAFAGTYIIHLDYDEWTSDLDQLGFKGGSIPIIMAIDTMGKIASILDGDDYKGSGVETAPPIKQFLRAHLWKTAVQKLVTNPKP